MHISRLTSIGLAASLLAGVAIPASADVSVVANLTKNRDIRITEEILGDKAFFIHVQPMLMPQGAAEAEAIINADNRNNSNVLDNLDVREMNLIASIDGSIQTNTGVIGVNQDVGNFVNQGNVVAFALTDSETSFADAQAWTDQTNGTAGDPPDNTLIQFENDTGIVDVPGKPPGVIPLNQSRTATITDAVTGNNGIVGVNQNAGDINNQHNSVAISVGLGAIAALSESVLGQDSTNNQVTETNVARSNTITTSVNANVGITAVNQTSGNFNNQASVVSFSGATSQVAIANPSI